MTARFVRYELRTVDIDAARAFYEALLEEGCPDVSVLPEVARARGAKSHWLGHLGVDDVRASTDAFVARGAMELGDGRLIRDPGGPVLALTKVSRATRQDIIWHQLLTNDLAAAKENYCALFGWTIGKRVEIEGFGPYEQFSWGAEPVGSIGDIRAHAHIHPQWLFYFRVAELDRAMDYVQRRGGLVVGPTTLPDGRRVAACDDPQHAAFAMMQPATF